MLSFFFPPPPPPPPVALTLTLTLPVWITADVLLTVVFVLLTALVIRAVWHPAVPLVHVELSPDEASDVLTGAPLTAPQPASDTVHCYDPSTGRFLGSEHAASAAEVQACVARASEAQRVWAGSSFSERRRLMRILSRCTLEHAEDICRISARDSGKTTTDAAFGEVLVTLEKLSWLCAEGEQALRPEARSAGRMLFYKRARVEWHPRGVVGAIVPWNYPFHNVLNPISAALFSGNAIVVKVSEHAAWSSRFYGRLIRACLAAAGAPVDLVQLVTGFGETGAALTREVALMTFVGSTRVGKMVMAEASKSLTPVVLELGGKDPFVLLPGTNVGALVDTAARAGWGAGGQNCIGAERFFVHSSLVGEFVERLATIAKAMRQGPPLNNHGNTGVDIGALCLPGESERIQGLVEDARKYGATVVAGGVPAAPTAGEGGQFFAPTLVLVPDPSANPSVARMRLLQEEVFGPLITVIPFEDEASLVALVNGCPFALGSSVFAPSDASAVRVGRKMDAGMLACNDFATCYMCQSLPMGGLKDSGFGKFAGVEGLRGLCVAKVAHHDRTPRAPVGPRAAPPTRPQLTQSASPYLAGGRGRHRAVCAHAAAAAAALPAVARGVPFRARAHAVLLWPLPRHQARRRRRARPVCAAAIERQGKVKAPA